MKKAILALIMLTLCSDVFPGEVGLPLEQVALPAVQGQHLVCIWDETAGAWLQAFESYDHMGSYGFQLPEWDKWYWLGLWDSERGEYVFGKWIGHFVTD